MGDSRQKMSKWSDFGQCSLPNLLLRPGLGPGQVVLEAVGACRGGLK